MKLRLLLPGGLGLLLAFAGPAWADGLIRDGVGAVSTGRGGTNIAHSDNGAVLLDNPAGIINAPGRGLFEFGIDTLATDLHYSDADPNDPIGGGRGGPGASDSDPSDPPGRGRGGSRNASDSDPNDPPGQGRGGSRNASDSDPNDPPGRGRGGSRNASDSDPNDPPGQGRGGGGKGAGQQQRTRQVTDNDPEDPAGRGRGWP